MEYRVSIIVPVYRATAYIECCARSLFEQDMESIEYLFVDDCCPEQSIQLVEYILQEYPNRMADVRIIKNTVNGGSSYARNRGIEMATGDFLTFCDADDWIDPQAITSMYKQIVQQEADILWTDFYEAFSKRNVRQKQGMALTPQSCIKALLMEKMHGALWNKMYKRQLFVTNAIQFPEGTDMWEDLYTNIRLFYFAEKVAHLPEAYYYYNQENSCSIGKNLSPKKISDIFQNADAIIQFFGKPEPIEYVDALQILRLAAKQTFLFSIRLKSYKEWVNIYPESNKYILQFEALPLHLRCIGWMAAHRCWSIIRCWIFFKKIKSIS